MELVAPTWNEAEAVTTDTCSSRYRLLLLTGQLRNASAIFIAAVDVAADDDDATFNGTCTSCIVSACKFELNSGALQRYPMVNETQE